MLLIDAARRFAVFHSERGGGADRLAEHRRRRHDPGRTQRHVRRRNIAPGEEQIVDVDRVERTVRNAERRRRRVEDRRRAGIIDRFGVVVVHGPAAVGDRVVEFPFGFDLLLAEHVIADIADVLALAGQAADPVKLPLAAAAVPDGS